MRYNTWGYSEEKMRIRLGCGTYYMRCWLRLLRRSQLLSSYPLPMSMLSPGGIDCNRLPLELNSSIEFKSSFKRSKKFLPLELDTWKVIFYYERIKFHSDFLQKSQEDLHENNRIDIIFLISLLTIWWRGYCCLLG